MFLLSLYENPYIDVEAYISSKWKIKWFGFWWKCRFWLKLPMKTDLFNGSFHRKSEIILVFFIEHKNNFLWFSCKIENSQNVDRCTCTCCHGIFWIIVWNPLFNILHSSQCDWERNTLISVLGCWWWFLIQNSDNLTTCYELRFL